MNSIEQTKHLDEFLALMKQTISQKADDYAGDDRLSNFKDSGKICKIGPEKVILALISTKVARISNLLESQQNPRNESMSDSLLDLANYAVLLHMVINE
jgi:hypothetical protein